MHVGLDTLACETTVDPLQLMSITRFYMLTLKAKLSSFSFLCMHVLYIIHTVECEEREICHVTIS